jgi:hypothetical protein
MSLLLLLAVTLFVPVVEGAEEIRTGLLALTIVAVKDYFDKRKVQNDADGPPLHDPVQG